MTLSLDVEPQVVTLENSLKAQREEIQGLITLRTSLENDFRESHSIALDKIKMNEVIRKAREAAQTTEELQHIHNAHKAVESKAKDIETAEKHLEVLLRQTRPKIGDKLYCLEKERQKIVTQVDTHARTHTETHTCWQICT